MIILLLILLFSFDSSASTLSEDDYIIQTSIEEITEDTDGIATEEPATEVVSDSNVLQDYGLNNLISFSYIRDLPDSVSLADFYIVVVRIYNLILMAVWILIAFDVMDLVSKSIGRLKRKN